MKDKAGQKTVNYYFMPCALKPADVEREERDGSVSPAPLLICFECGYTPVGVFCCLVVYLLDQKTDQVLEWKLTGNDQYRNRITFQVGQYYDTVTLISRATYLEIWVQQQMSPSLNDLSDKILSSLHKGLDTVTQSLHYTYKSKHMFGVPCTCTGVPHPAVIEHCSEGAKCTNGNLLKLGEKHLYWSKKVVDLNTGAQKSNKSQPSGNVATENEILPESIFQSHLADITNAISSDVTRVAVDLCTKFLLPTSLKNDLSSLLGVSDFDKANKITSYIHKHIISNSTVEAAEYLTTVCNVLYQRDDMRLRKIIADICKELGKPIPKGNKKTKSKSYASKRVHGTAGGRQPKDMQGEMSVNKRLKLSELSVIDDESQSSNNTSSVLGVKRHSEDESSESVLTNKKQKFIQSSSNEVISLLSDDDDVLILDPPSPLDKGYGKRSTGNKPHRRKTGSKK
ncbi:PREDICTED: uncharacterized protein LOC105311977 [Amphimedon queenslandica]|nr:PREDICTED: uncharacterized protein LOC105311977 [Amphimedon queenslandica]|eukprot:XP_019849648.1 PREDICTED: uncharacterized protein LOC105311977 [Amphimedon queenslandica]